MNTFEFKNANSHKTYFTIHNIYKAHKTVLGKNIKVGIIDWFFSSMSPVLAGLIALMKECKHDLAFEECRQILIDTSYSITDKDRDWYGISMQQGC